LKCDFLFYFAECSRASWSNSAAAAVFWNTFNKGKAECLRIIRIVTVGREPEQEKPVGKLVGRGQA